MTGGLMQLVGKGAQDTLLTGNPSFTHFRSVYKRHTEFAMEHFRLYFKTTNLNLPQSGSLTLRAKVERYAQLLYDCYLNISLPDIYSPVTQSGVGYEFQWVKNLGYNMINYVAIVINGQEIARHTGEWMKLYSYLKFSENKKAMINEMTGNTPDLYDPANAFGRTQYPHSISSSTQVAAPSIAGKTLTIPLHFWFCESIGSAIPLIALQHSEIEFVVELKNIYQLFTVKDVRSSVNGSANPNFRNRTAYSNIATNLSMSMFLSPPTSTLSPTNSNLNTWKLNPFMECNYIFVSDAEMAHIASTDHSFILTQIDMREAFGQYGPSNDLDLIMRNLCTRVIWVCQRSDRLKINDYDNYSNWDSSSPPGSGWFSTSGYQLPSGVTSRDILVESSIVIDGKERFGIKQAEFFRNIQNYRHHEGRTTDLFGIYSYSFALEHDKPQPCGHINGSQFNKTILQNTYIQPPLASYAGVTVAPTQICVLKSTANSPHPVQVDPTLKDKSGKLVYNPSDVVTVVQLAGSNSLAYTFTVRAYVESYNFLRVMGGIANVVFSS